MRHKGSSDLIGRRYLSGGYLVRNQLSDRSHVMKPCVGRLIFYVKLIPRFKILPVEVFGNSFIILTTLGYL